MLLIFDEVDTPQRFPLPKLIDVIQQLAPLHGESWFVTQASGYGLDVNKLASDLDNAETVTIDASELRALAEGIDQWFHNLKARSEDGMLTFGLADSSFLFFEGSDAMTQTVAMSFQHTQMQQSTERCNP